mmetsp:Transcript_13551/g.34509  ORF Transcript_13551/g.34509 Transcript_13551/m.34509 type:complete len:220 (+) Transcript_13551:112-771(+)
MWLEKPEEFETGSIASWKLGHNLMSAKIMVTTCIVGPGVEIEKTLPFPSELARTTKDIFDTTSYTDKEKAQGREVLYLLIDLFLLARFGLIFIDTNRLILENDRNFGKSIGWVLTWRYGLQEVRTFMNGELTLYINKNKTHGVIVHRPLCVAGDSKATTPMWHRLRRALAAAAAANVGRTFRGEPFLTKATVGYDPVAAISILQIARRGEHNGTRQATA